MATQISVKVLGVAKILKRLQRMQGAVPQAISRGLYLEGNNIMTESKRLVPVDLGTLRASGYVTLPEMHGGKMVTELGYGGPAAEYAEIQHEKTELKHPEGGEAKYLEKPFLKRSNAVPRNVAKIARAALEYGISVAPIKNPQMPATPNDGPFPQQTKRKRRKK